ncbi:Lysophospholipid acyltransferase 2 [Halotydeus destructor]|nr:Lysophospholipid acyltransferase 2 [Halotydeus destructor]
MDMQNVEYLNAAYHGSRYFETLGDAIGFQIDRINFIITQLTGLLLAFLYRWFLGYDKYSSRVRLIAVIIPGIGLGLFCYGRDIFHLFGLSGFSYLTLIMSDVKNVHKNVLVIAIGYLSMLHLLRMYFDYGGYVLDITGPIMIAVQKVTSLAYNVHDGMHRKESELTEEQRKFSVKRMPSALEFFAYLIAFQTLMCGPLVCYVDFMEFIHGTNFERHVPKNGKNPSPGRAVLTKLSISTLFALGVLYVQPLLTHELLKDEAWLAKTSFLSLLIYVTAVLTANRFKYYFAWVLGETLCNASGLGFAGYDEENNADWDLVSNVSIWKLETSLNFKVLLDNWNKSTQTWLRRYAYERVKRNRLVMTYVLSALWHGFYPGYYMCFLTAALVTQGARSGRRSLRPIFKGEKSSSAMGIFYDVITFLLTRLYLGYTCAPFVLLSFQDGIRLYKNLYFVGHILCLFAIFVLPVIVPPPRVPKPTTSASKETKKTD